MCNGNCNGSAATEACARATADAATAAGARAKATAAAAAAGARTRATAAAAMAGARAKASLARQRASSIGSYSANNLVCRLVCHLVRHLVKVVAARGRRAVVAGGNLDQPRCINLCRGRCRTRRAQTSVCTTPVRQRTAPTSSHFLMSLSRPPRMGASCGPPSKSWSQVKATAKPALLNRVSRQYRCRQRRARKWPLSVCVLLLRDKPQPAAVHSSPPWSAERKSETGKGDHRAGDRQEPYWHRRCQRPARAWPQSPRRPRGHPPSRTNRSPPPSTATPHGPPSESRKEAKGTAARSSPGTGVVSAQSGNGPVRYDLRLQGDSADNPPQRTPDA